MPDTLPSEDDLYQQIAAGRNEQRAIWRDGSINPPKKINRKKVMLLIGVVFALAMTLYFLLELA
jgi:hypothetical protein